MANGLFSTVKAFRDEFAAFIAEARREFSHITTALGDILRDLAEIKALLRTRKKP